jgi:peptidoglycan/LPS O-acetylase OafA/YrhL
VPALLRGSVNFLASYSYSLYLIHNTALILVLEHIRTQSAWTRVAIAVIAAHSCAYLLYLAFERHYRIVGRWLRPKFERALVPRGVTRLTTTAAAEIVARGTAAAPRQEP